MLNWSIHISRIDLQFLQWHPHYAFQTFQFKTLKLKRTVTLLIWRAVIFFFQLTTHFPSLQKASRSNPHLHFSNCMRSDITSVPFCRTTFHKKNQLYTTGCLRMMKSWSSSYLFSSFPWLKEWGSSPPEDVRISSNVFTFIISLYNNYVPDECPWMVTINGIQTKLNINV